MRGGLCVDRRGQFVLIQSLDSLRTVLLALGLFSCTASHRRAVRGLDSYVSWLFNASFPLVSHRDLH